METETQTGTCPSEVLTLFGMEGPVGCHFVKLALSAGYRVQALVPPDALLPPIQHDCLEIHIAELDRVEESVLQDLLMHSTHVVCLWTCQGYSTLSPSSSSSSSASSSSSTKRGGGAGGENKENNMSKTKKRYPPGALFKFVQRLYPLVKESTARVFLYQVSVLFVIVSPHCRSFWFTFSHLRISTIILIPFFSKGNVNRNRHVRSGPPIGKCHQMGAEQSISKRC